MEKLANQKQTDYFWRKKEFVSFVLSILVFFIHISSFVPYLGGDDAIAILNQNLSFFFKESITRFAVPMYFILSGIAFFRDYDNGKYISKIKKRFFTLCIPYLIWNTLWMLFEIICSYTAVSTLFVGRKMFSLSIPNVPKGIFLFGSNLPFWYIFYLIVFVLLSPVFDLLVRNKKAGIAATVVLSVLSIFEIGGSYRLNYDAIVFY
ncbi:MAG: acyltransferase [Clostridia bacterium]|nr:acyltransferase [Clostridia bacterium]